jgi:hypothetical protein
LFEAMPAAQIHLSAPLRPLREQKLAQRRDAATRFRSPNRRIFQATHRVMASASQTSAIPTHAKMTVGGLIS